MSLTESQILNAFLVSSSGLKDIATLNTFISLFPSSKRIRSHPDLPALYRLLQAQRSAVCQTIKKNIELECKLGLFKSMEKQETPAKEAQEDATDIYDEVGGGLSMMCVKGGECAKVWIDHWQLGINKPLGLTEVLKQMEEAVDKMQKEMEKLGKGCDDLLQNMKMIVHEISDSSSEKQELDHAEETVDGLKELIETCEELLKNCENTYQQTQKTSD
ncbi:hypothetical protein PORY_002540 [Pneumocystis oryctolagi]|uniref:Uncharacterized protein n=1 Tax=Pneumocystis oryctolagi TaxID=42067 RepID=A0ACB7CC16_9ASCO|nr:hypothetical protein PORY_002540 [Pneumocystis oryctolagi]